jgi:hypothetical protein
MKAPSQARWGWTATGQPTSLVNRSCTIFVESFVLARFRIQFQSLDEGPDMVVHESCALTDGHFQLRVSTKAICRFLHAH